MISPGTLLVTGVVIAVFVGSKHLRHLAGELGSALRQFRQGLEGAPPTSEENVKKEEAEPPQKPSI